MCAGPESGQINGRYPALPDQHVHEVPHGPGQLLVSQTPEPDVEEVLLAKAPAVSRDILAEVELGRVRPDFATLGLGGIHLELDLLSGHEPLVTPGGGT